jgi:hypothetical protein
MTLHLFQFERGRHSARNAGTRSVGMSSHEHNRWARYLNATLGLWLFLSAFIWQHVPSSQMNTCLVGLFVGVSAVTATGWAEARRLTAVLALWLAFTTLAVYPARPATLWNNLIVAVAVLALSLVPDEFRPARPRPPEH